MDDYLLSAKVGLLSHRNLESRKYVEKTKRTAKEGGIPTLSLLGSQNALNVPAPAIEKSLDKIAKEMSLILKPTRPLYGQTRRIIPTMDLAPPQPSRPIYGQTRRIIPRLDLTPQEQKEAQKMGFVPAKQARIDTAALREVKEQRKDTTEAEAELAEQPALRPPFWLPEDEANETKYGEYLRKRYPGSVGRLEYDKMIEEDIAFTAVLKYAWKVQEKYVEMLKDTSYGQKDLLVFLGKIAIDLSKDLAKEVVREVILQITPTRQEEKKKVYLVPDYVRDKIADKVKEALPSGELTTQQDRLDALKKEFNAIFEGEPKTWKSKVTYYTGIDGNKVMSKSGFEKETEKKREEDVNKREEENATRIEDLKKKYEPIIKQEKLEDDKLQNKADTYARNEAINSGKLDVWEKTPLEARTRKNLAAYKKYVIENKIKTDYAKKSAAERNKLREERIKARVYKATGGTKMGSSTEISKATKNYDDKHAWELF